MSVAVLIVVAGSKTVTLLHANADSSASVAAAAVAATSGEPHGADWQQEMAILGIPAAPNPNATSSSDTIAMIGPMVTAEIFGQYAGLAQRGDFSSSTVASAANAIAPNVRAVVSYPTYSASDLKTDPDTSYNRMLEYRADLRASLAPLLKNTDAEFEIYAKYVQTSDPIYLAQLSAAADNYRAAASSTAAVVVPQDAVVYHVAILNAMSQFASVLDSMAAHGDDPIASAALLRSYNQAEQDMFNSFNNLTLYYSRKNP